MEIIPSIIAPDLKDLKARLSQIEGLTKWAEIDVMDGVFVPNYTWPMKLGQAPEDLKQIPGETKLSVHLMVEEPEAIVEDWLELADRLVIHHESTQDFDKLIEAIGPNVSLALAVELGTPIEKVYKYLDRIKLLQLMSIERTGYSGEKFDERIFEKIKTLNANWPDVKIIVDGGVNLENARQLRDLGVSGLVVGSQIWSASNIEEVVKKFQDL